MQAVFLLAGENSRYYPLNTGPHKGMTKIYGKPLLAYSVEAFVKAGVDDFVFVVNPRNEDIREYFSSWKISAKYAVQETPGGQGDALLCAKGLIHEPFVITNPYHIEDTAFIKAVLETFSSRGVDGLIPGQYVEHIHDYGALVLEGDKIKGIVEKPAPGTEPSHYKATSSYMFKPEFLSYLAKEQGEHYSYEAAISKYAQDHTIIMFEIPREQVNPSLKYPWHLLKMRAALAQKIPGYISPHAVIAKTAVVSPDAYIDDGARIMDGAHIVGHSYIGKNAFIGNYAVVRDSDIEDHVQIGVYSEIARSVIMEGTHSHGGGFIGDSVIGRDCRLARGFCTANKRLDRAEIFHYTKTKKVSTMTNALGVMMGSGVKTGMNVSVMPGVVIGPNAILMTGVIAYHNVPENTSVLFKQTQTQKPL